MLKFHGSILILQGRKSALPSEAEVFSGPFPPFLGNEVDEILDLLLKINGHLSKKGFNAFHVGRLTGHMFLLVSRYINISAREEAELGGKGGRQSRAWR